MRYIRRLSVLAPALAAVLVFPMTPAHAGESSPVSFAADNSDCPDPARGDFYHVGDIFTVKDTCIDGKSGVLLVDIAPFESGDFHDRQVWAPGGSGDSKSWNTNVKEGRRVAVKACTGQYRLRTYGGCDSRWRFGRA